MKKLIAALIATACAGAMAQFAVYDYSSSIKRLNPEIKKGSYKDADNTKVTTYLARFAVKSDKITGYVQLPICNACSEGGVVGTLYEGEPEAYVNNETEYYNNINFHNGLYSAHINDCNTQIFGQNCYDYGLYGQAFLTRKGDSYVKKAGHPVYRVVVRAEIGIFGSYVDVRKNNVNIPDGHPNVGCKWFAWPVDNGKAATKAWMSMSYALPNGADTPLLKDFVKASDDVERYPFGLLGWGNWLGSTVYETAFGTLTTDDSSDTENVCGGVTPGKHCKVVKQMSGSLTGWPRIEGPCGINAIWDLCDLSVSTNAAVITGTWTLKFNKKLTGDGSMTAQWDDILKKLSVTAEKVWDTTDAQKNIAGVYHQPEDIPVLLNNYYNTCNGVQPVNPEPDPAIVVPAP